MDSIFMFWHFGLIAFMLFHMLFKALPIHSLFVFLFFIISIASFVVFLNVNYLGLVLISVYGGAIVVLFLLVSMLFNKKKISVLKR